MAQEAAEQDLLLILGMVLEMIGKLYLLVGHHLQIEIISQLHP